MMHSRTITNDDFAVSAYGRSNGSVGVRNHLLILNLTGLTEAAARRASVALPNSIFVSFPYGMGMTGQDQAASNRALSGLARHPNVGAVVLVSADRTRLEQIAEIVEADGRQVVGLCLDETRHDQLSLADLIVRAGVCQMRIASATRRRLAPPDKLCLAVECGLSDPTSGLAANRLIGRVTDRIVATGGTVIMGETLEWLGVEDMLADRAVSESVARDIKAAVTRREALAQSAGIDLLGVNPNRRNIEEGLTTIEEKASGSIAKSGTVQIEGVLQYAEAPGSPGLWLMDQPSYTPESLTGFAAAGAQIALFSTGSGNSYVSALMPTLKITANAGTARRLGAQIDFDCSGLMRGGDMNEAADALVSHLSDVASGTLTCGEITGEGMEVISRFGEAL